MPIKCHFCENNNHGGPVEECQRVFITTDEALSLLDYGSDDVHVFIASRVGVLVGADWSVPHIVKLLENAKHIEISGCTSRKMKHAVCVHVDDDEQHNHFLATNEEKLKAFEELYGIA